MSPTKLPTLRGRRKPLTRANARTNVADDPGTVQVSVILIDPAHGQHKRGNCTRSFRLANCRVSEVAESLRKWFFGDGSPDAKVPHVRL